MIKEKNAKAYCSEDISLIENYELAVNDPTQVWDCHHRLETDEGLSQQELEESNRYYGVEAKYLIFLTEHDHLSLHAKCKKGEKNPFYGRCHSEDTKQKMRKPKSEEAKQHIREGALKRWHK